MSVDVKLYDGISRTPALDLAMRGWADTVDHGFGDGTLNVFSSIKAFVAFTENGRDMLPVGVLTWDEDAVLKRIWIYQGYVLPEFRGRGVYSALWAALVNHATANTKVVAIESATHIKNITMRAVANRLGRVEEAVTLRFDIARES